MVQSSLSAQPGMTYDLEVVDTLQLPADGLISFVGNVSIPYDRLIPADAVIEANGIAVEKIHLSIQPTVGIGATHIAVATRDNIDLTHLLGKRLVLRCMFSS